MASPRDVVVRFLSETRDFLRGTDQIADAYDDMAADQRLLEQKGEQSARDLARAYERAGDKISRDARDSARTTKRAYGEVGKESGQEFAQNLGQSISSGDLSGLAQETAGGLASTFAAAGKTGGLAFAGLATAASVAFAQISAASEKASQAATDAFDQIINKASAEEKLRGRLELYFGTYEKGLAEVQRLSDATGVPVREISDALIAGGPAARTLAIESEKIAKSLGDGRVVAGSRGLKITPAEVASLEKLAKYMELTADATDRAAAAERRRRDALGQSLSNAELLNRASEGADAQLYARGRR